MDGWGEWDMPGIWNDKNQMLVTYLPVAAVLFVAAHVIEAAPLPLMQYVWLCLGGYLLWSAIEYGIHRFAFHWYRKSLFFPELTYEIHVEHHKQPLDKSHTVVPKRLSFPIFLLIILLCIAILRDAPRGMILAAIVVVFYATFEVLHWRSHDESCNDFLTRAVRSYHEHHHFTSNKENFGVTSPLGDWIFGTSAGRKSRRKLRASHSE